ncbi:MAG: aminomethyl-transferring glycine dehydrogenase subunit GcvPA [Chloroflexi bacterium]|nr:aminomethyl-transferring glycine dehydrogenase subunit GcvPA [Chloroflexota bacterium]
MSYLPHTDADRAAMLASVGVKGIEDLFADVPARVRFPKLDLPGPLSELEVMQELTELAESNASAGQFACFLGAGAYNHFSPSIVNHTILRGEFLTGYTPYQPEVSQGTLQTIYEYQSMICALTGMEVSNASHYDGATSLAEAVIMAVSHFKDTRRKVVVSPAVHPQYRAVIRTYVQGMGLTVTGDEEPDTDIADLTKMLDGDTAIFIVQSPNFFGQIEDPAGLAHTVHSAGNDALLCVMCDPISLGILKPPGQYGADIVVGEGQSLGIPLSYGGPYLGFFATRKSLVRQMAGRLVGEAHDAQGRRGFVLTLATREQHIKRERATSNICTNSGLVAIAATVYLATMGKNGMRKVAELCYHKSHYAAQEIAKLAGYRVRTDKPFFKEFAVQCPIPVAEINAHLFDEHGIIGGYDLGQDYAHLDGHMLLAVTEMNTREEIDGLVAALGELSGD